MKRILAALIFALALANAAGSCSDDESSGDDAGTDTDTCEGLVLSDDHLIETQADLDLSSGYSEVTGSLNIECDECTSLEPLGCLTRVGESLRITYNEQLTTLYGLESLEEVGLEVRISDNPALIDVSATDGLLTVGDGSWAHGVFVRWNPSITIVDGFGSLVEINGSVRIDTNASLLTVAGFDSLVSIRNWLHIDDNPQLNDIGGFAGLTSLFERLVITDNDSLPTCDAIEISEQLTFHGGGVCVHSNQPDSCEDVLWGC